MKQSQPEKKSFTLRDRGGVIDKGKPWYISFTQNGKRVRKYGDINQASTVEERNRRARKLIRKLKIEYAVVPQNIDQKEKIYKALEFDQPYLRKKSYQTYKSKLDQLFEWLGDREMTIDRLKDYFILYRRHHTQTGTYDCRRMFMTYFKKSGYNHLLESIRIKKGQHQPLRYFQPHQCKIILQHLLESDYMLYLHCLFIYYTALSPRAELLQLRIDDIFFEDRKIAIRVEYAKNHKTQFVRIAPICYPVVEKLKQQKPGTYIFPSQRDKYRPAGCKRNKHRRLAP